MTPPDRWTALSVNDRWSIIEKNTRDALERYGINERIKIPCVDLLELVAAARAGRTPGTFECCNKCKATEKTWWDECKHTDCPLHTTPGASP